MSTQNRNEPVIHPAVPQLLSFFAIYKGMEGKYRLLRDTFQEVLPVVKLLCEVLNYEMTPAPFEAENDVCYYSNESGGGYFKLNSTRSALSYGLPKAIVPKAHGPLAVGSPHLRFALNRTGVTDVTLTEKYKGAYAEAFIAYLLEWCLTNNLVLEYA